jgi:uncharacterized NAD(P)/FAD-binding protein YdhS
MSNKTSDNVANIERLNNFVNMTFLYGNRVNLNVSGLKEIQNDIKNILSDYTRQKQINEEHQKLNGELREAINTVEKEKADWINAYQEEKDSQFDLLKRIKELEEENAILKKASNIAKDVNIEDITEVMNKSCEEFMSNYINKQVVIDTINENGFEVYTREYGNIEVVSIDVLQELLERKK